MYVCEFQFWKHIRPSSLKLETNLWIHIVNWCFVHCFWGWWHDIHSFHVVICWFCLAFWEIREAFSPPFYTLISLFIFLSLPCTWPSQKRPWAHFWVTTYQLITFALVCCIGETVETPFQWVIQCIYVSEIIYSVFDVKKTFCQKALCACELQASLCSSSHWPHYFSVLWTLHNNLKQNLYEFLCSVQHKISCFEDNT